MNNEPPSIFIHSHLFLLDPFAFYLTNVIGFCKINAYAMQCKMEEILTKKND
jgi:hypothetical protein